MNLLILVEQYFFTNFAEYTAKIITEHIYF